MLTIRAAQMAVLEREAEKQFLLAAVGFLRQEVPEVVGSASDDEVYALAEDCLRRARRCGIHDEHCVRQFMLFTAWCGPGFEEKPWARRILKDGSRSELTRIVLLEDHILSTIAAG